MTISYSFSGNCIVCDYKRRYPKSHVCIIDLNMGGVKLCKKHDDMRTSSEVVEFKSGLDMNKWAGTLTKGLYFYRVTR